MSQDTFADGFGFVKQIVNIASFLVVDSEIRIVSGFIEPENGPQGFNFSLPLMGVFLGLNMRYYEC